MNDDVHDVWNSTTDDELTLELAKKYFATLWDELYIASAAIDRVVDDPILQRFLLDKALSSTGSALERGKSGLSTALLLQDASAEEQEHNKGEGTSSSSPNTTTPSPLVTPDDNLGRLLSLRFIAFQRSDLLETYNLISSNPSWTSTSSKDSPPEENTEDEDEDEDPWADDDIPVEDYPQPPSSTPPPLLLSQLLSNDLLASALRLLSSSHFAAVRIMIDRHPYLFQHRYTLIESIPPFISPLQYASILPAVDHKTNSETVYFHQRIREELDWVETSVGKQVYQLYLDEHYSDFVLEQEHVTEGSSRLLSIEELSEWYTARILYVDGNVGLTDIALELVQHGASQGIPGLDLIGEELSLLSRLVYDTPGAQNAKADAKAWSLERWRSLDEHEIVRGYLARSTEDTVADDIRHLVMPYLFVLEARAERAGKPDSNLPTRFLYEYTLSAPLALCAAIFEASKPTSAAPHRIIKDDEDLARLALARLYGSTELDQWPTKSSIFECLPEWPVPSEEDQEDGANSADMTLTSLASFVQPSTTRAHSAPPPDLFVFFKPLPAPALSRALDILDVHLECGEILARWGVPAPLAWFLQSAHDERQQRSWATRIARRATMVGGDDERRGDKTATYGALLKDMQKLVGSGNEKARGAFRLLGKDEVTKIFFSGLLSSGEFEIAKKFLTNPNVRKLSSQVIEDMCLAASREFYDNAQSGNVHHGDMKLAFDCLSVPPISDTIRSEREFIEATSRICSYKVMSRPGIPITPLEIRLVKDRLSLVARILSENGDAYKYPEVILELVHKLGYKEDDVASEIKVYAMNSDSALQAEDFRTAADTTEKMVLLLANKNAQVSSLNGTNGDLATNPANEDLAEATERCWHACFQLGRQSEYADVKKKMQLLGHALQLCPPENTLDILAVWRRLESENMTAARASGGWRRRGEGSRRSGNGRLPEGSVTSSSTFGGHLSDYTPSSEQLLAQGSDAAALAKQTLSRVAANFPLSLRGIRGRGAVQDDGDASSVRSSTRSITPDVSAHARQALSRGMGWLIGDEE